jgi:hypothetical protein
LKSGDELEDLALHSTAMARLHSLCDLEQQVEERSRQLVRSSMVSVGFLAAGVAEINNRSRRSRFAPKLYKRD